MLLAIPHVVNPFAVEVSRDFDIEALFRITNLAAIIGAIPYGSATIMGLYERLSLPTLGTSADWTVWVFFGLSRGLCLPPSSRQYCQEQSCTDNRVAHFQQCSPREVATIVVVTSPL